MNREPPDVGERILRWARAKNVKLSALAKAADVTPSAVSCWVSPDPDTRTRPSLQHLEAIVRKFELTMVQFYGPLPKAKAKAS